MRWIKHLTTSRNDPSMRLLMAEYGYEGYGIYWSILEKIAENLKHDTAPEATMSIQQWCNSGRISPKKFYNIVVFCSKLNFFSMENSQNLITIKCPKLLKYRDEYTRKKG